MGFLDQFFGNKNEPKENVDSVWKPIVTIEDLEQAISESQTHKIIIFKHSTRCFISKSVLRKFEKQIQENQKDLGFYFLDLIAHREISNAIAECFAVTHQSPQIIVVENGASIFNASHDSISLDDIN